MTTNSTTVTQEPKRRNVQINDEIWRRVNVLAAQRSEAVWRTVERLLSVGLEHEKQPADDASGTPARQVINSLRKSKSEK